MKDDLILVTGAGGFIGGQMVGEIGVVPAHSHVKNVLGEDGQGEERELLEQRIRPCCGGCIFELYNGIGHPRPILGAGWTRPGRAIFANSKEGGETPPLQDDVTSWIVRE